MKEAKNKFAFGSSNKKADKSNDRETERLMGCKILRHKNLIILFFIIFIIQ
jgi:hypothetical protein